MPTILIFTISLGWRYGIVNMEGLAITTVVAAVLYVAVLIRFAMRKIDASGPSK